jgi:hypothetical protein
MTALISNHDGLITRRSIFIGAAASLICAPAIVRATSLMPVRRLRGPIGPQYAVRAGIPDRDSCSAPNFEKLCGAFNPHIDFAP